MRLRRWAASEGYLVLLVCAAASLMLLGAGIFVMSDTWLALVAGRAVAESGPPSTDSLTAWTLGRDWIDQQWLGQLVLFEVWRVGGMALLGFVHAVVVVATFVATLAGARRRGGSSSHVALVGLLALLPIGLVAGNIRTQTFALALFVLVLWLLAQDSRVPRVRVYWCAPLLVLWANVHGSVLLGGALVALAGAVWIVTGLRDGRRDLLAHGAALIALVPLALLATPYGTSLATYFADLFGNDEIGRLAPEWMATTLAPAWVPFYVLAGLAVALVARDRRRLTTFEQLALGMVLVGALAAERNVAWFALCAVLLLPALVTARRPQPREPLPAALATAVATLAAAAVVAAGVSGLSRMDEQVQSRFPDAAAGAVARAAAGDGSLELFTHPRYADWLLFGQPQLAGRVPFDIRYELLKPAELRRFRRVRDQIGDDWPAALGGARLVVLDSSEEPLDGLPSTSSVLLRRRGARSLYARDDVAVVLLP